VKCELHTSSIQRAWFYERTFCVGAGCQNHSCQLGRGCAWGLSCHNDFSV